MDQTDERIIMDALANIDRIEREDPPMNFTKKYVQHFQIYSYYRDIIPKIMNNQI
jgi:hypothetical protein